MGILRPEKSDVSRLVWRDRTGREIGSLSSPTDYWGVALSPDDKFAAVVKHDYLSGQFAIWTAQLPQGLLEPFSEAAHIASMTWSPDSTGLYYSDFRQRKLLRRTVSVPGHEETVWEPANDGPGYPVIRDISPDGRTGVFEISLNSVHSEVVWIGLGTGERRPTGATGRLPGLLPRLSPNGAWLSWASTQTGNREVYVTRFPVGARQWRISLNGGSQPQWRKDGRELFYIAGDGTLMALEIPAAGTDPRASSAKPLFRTALRRGSDGRLYSVTADGQRFLMIEGLDDPGTSNIEMVLNWMNLSGR